MTVTESCRPESRGCALPGGFESSGSRMIDSLWVRRCDGATVRCGGLRLNPTFVMCRALVDGAGPAAFVGGPFDVRAVWRLSGPRPAAELSSTTSPWGNLPHGEEARDAVRQPHTADGTGPDATAVLIGMCADDSRAAAARAVPLLIRIAADPHHPHRADALGALAASARAVTSEPPPAANPSAAPASCTASSTNTASGDQLPGGLVGSRSPGRDHRRNLSAPVCSPQRGLPLRNETDPAMEVLPWMTAAGSGEPGLLRCVRRIPHPEEAEPYDDPWPRRPEE